MPITLGEDVSLEWRAHSPPQGNDGVNARSFQPDESEFPTQEVIPKQAKLN